MPTPARPEPRRKRLAGSGVVEKAWLKSEMLTVHAAVDPVGQATWMSLTMTSSPCDGKVIESLWLPAIDTNRLPSTGPSTSKTPGEQGSTVHRLLSFPPPRTVSAIVPLLPASPAPATRLRWASV